MNQPSQGQSTPVLQSVHQLVSLGGFLGIIWTGFAMCTLSCGARLYIRYVCFRRLLIEDYLMILAMAIIFTITVITQLYIGDVYYIMAVGNGEEMPGPTFPDDMKRGLLGTMLHSVLTLIALWIVKFNFLLFFRRLGRDIPKYHIFWWIVTVTTAACGVVAVGIVKYECLVSSFEHISTYCTTLPALQSENTSSIVSCVVDVVSDALILCFPITILWKVRISLRKKLILSAIFSVILFTIAVAVIRGSIFGGAYKSIYEDNLQSLNITWIWFWLSIECFVSFTVACLVSFRSLFIQPKHGSSPRESQKRRHLPRTQDSKLNAVSKFRARMIYLHDSILDTCMTLEGSTMVDREMSFLPHPPSGRLSLDSSSGRYWTEISSESNRHLSDPTHTLTYESTP